MSSLSQAIVNDLTAEDLQALAELLEPHLRQRPGASIKRADDGWLNSSAAAAYLGCSRDRLYDLRQRRVLVGAKDGRSLRFRRSELDAYLEGEPA